MMRQEADACKKATMESMRWSSRHEGSLPRRALALVLQWARAHRAELMEDWNLCRQRQSPKAIEPLR
jgi:hypothetical protein